MVVFAQGEAAKAAQDAGADEVGGDELVAKIQGGWFEFDKAVATTDMMGKVGRIGRILGPRGLMPNLKVGTVVPPAKVAEAVGQLKSGKIDFRVEKAGIVHARLVVHRWRPTSSPTTSQRWLRPCSGSSQPLPRVCT